MKANSFKNQIILPHFFVVTMKFHKNEIIKQYNDSNKVSDNLHASVLVWVHDCEGSFGSTT